MPCKRATNYTPREHFLEILSKEAEKHSSVPRNIFSKSTKEDEDRFKLLEYAYIGGRYDPEYRISKSDLEILARDAQKLLQLTGEGWGFFLVGVVAINSQT